MTGVLDMKVIIRQLSNILFGIIILSIILFFISCSSHQEMYLGNDGSGTTEVDISLHPVLMKYFRDIAGGFSTGQRVSEMRLFDVKKIKEKISSLPHVVLQSVKSPSAAELKVTLSFDRIDHLFPESSKSAVPVIFQFSKKGKINTLIFTLTKDNFSFLTGFFGLGGNEIMDTFGPQKDQPFSKAEYMEMIEYLFGEYGSKKEIDTILSASTVTLSVNVSGDIISMAGSSTVTTSFKGPLGKISIPLVEILTLVKPLVIKMSWK